MLSFPDTVDCSLRLAETVERLVPFFNFVRLFDSVVSSSLLLSFCSKPRCTLGNSALCTVCHGKPADNYTKIESRMGKNTTE
jgi:hypothetical protein